MTAIASPPPTLKTDSEVLNTTRLKVRELFGKSTAFHNLSPAQQKEIARNTVEILQYLSAPEGIPGNRLAALQNQARTRGEQLAQPLAGGNPKEKFEAVGAREGAQVAGLLLQQVNFPTFVSGLITGVFEAIVNSSIKQMEAYGQLVASVAQTLNSFRDQNVSDNQGRDHLVEQFPDIFDLDVDTGSEGAGPRVRLREGVDERTALDRVNSLPMEGGPLKSLDLEDEETESKLVQGSRTQLATSRQQLLATMVLMGINRIIVTDGRISAKVLYEFQAKDTFKRSATSFDYQNMGTRRVSEGEYESERQDARSSSTPGTGGSAPSFNNIGGSYYAKGLYKTTEEPLVKLRSAEASQQDANLSARASLAGQVEVNFKSETFPLEKMADSFQIGAIQNASQPKTASAPPSGAVAAVPPPAATPAPVAPVPGKN